MCQDGGAEFISASLSWDGCFEMEDRGEAARDGEHKKSADKMEAIRLLKKRWHGGEKRREKGGSSVPHEGGVARSSRKTVA